MRKKITRLVCAGMASCCVLMAAGQEKAAEVKIIDRYDLSESRSELRADKVEWWPDSVIAYNYLGELTWKEYYDKENRTWTYVPLENGTWVWHEPYNSSGVYFWGMQPYFIDDDNDFGLQLYSVFYAGQYLYSKQMYSCDTICDDKNNLILAEFTPREGVNAGTEKYRMEYNENNQIVLIERYLTDFLFSKRLYEYNENGDPEYYKSYVHNWESDLMEMNCIEHVKYDEQGRPVEGHSLRLTNGDINGEASFYEIYYYSDATYTPDIKLENNNPIGGDNQGNFDLNVNVPADSISSGSVTVTFPEGFTLDEENTSLTLDFAADFTLTITKQENNSWLLEIKPKALRSAPLRADEVQKAIQIAYQVDEEAKRGSYDISVNSILFETPTGNIIPEPAITVPVNVNRWGVANEGIEDANVAVYITGNTLYIQTPQSETITIYSINGSKLYEATVSSGTVTVDASAFPQGVLIVKGSSGWVKKIVKDS